MSNSYRHYRRVKIINNSCQDSPNIESFEEIVSNGKRQVYYWNNPKYKPKWDDSDFLLSSLIDLDNNWFNKDQLFVGFRYLNPDEVIVRDLSYHQRKRQQQNSRLSQLKKSIKEGISNIKKIAKRLPLALKAAWRELTIDD